MKLVTKCDNYDSKEKNCIFKLPLTPKSLIKKLSKEIPSIQNKKMKVSDSNFVVPQFEEYTCIEKYNYSVSQLKIMCRHYGRKITGVKSELRGRLYNYLRLSNSVVKIQRLVKLYFLRKYNTLKGPAKFNRGMCVNDTDFFSMDDIKDISYKLFVSIMDEDDNIVYGFNINSLYSLLTKNKEAKNPYNRKKLPNYTMRVVNKLIKYSRFVGDKIVLEKVEEDLTPLQRIDMRIFQIFQKMDMLGHYTDIMWFNNLDRLMLIKFIREISDIWHFRAQLSPRAKLDICPHSGNPFQTVPIGYQHNILSYPLNSLKRISLTIMEKMILYGISEHDQYLGSSYVLCALTLVNPEAAEALPILYESVSVPSEQ